MASAALISIVIVGIISKSVEALHHVEKIGIMIRTERKYLNCPLEMTLKNRTLVSFYPKQIMIGMRSRIYFKKIVRRVSQENSIQPTVIKISKLKWMN
jgi:hypothetical protein